MNVFTRYLQAKVQTQSGENMRSVANLYQTALETERDGTVLQDLYRFYIALKLPVYVGQFGMPGTDADLLADAKALAGKSCASPVDLSVPAWQIAGRKIWNWGEKNLHLRDVNTLATEMLREPGIIPLIPAMKAVKPEKIVVIGDSYTMDQHWASPSAFPPIVTEMFARENPGSNSSNGRMAGWTSRGRTAGTTTMPMRLPGSRISCSSWWRIIPPTT